MLSKCLWLLTFLSVDKIKEWPWWFVSAVHWTFLRRLLLTTNFAVTKRFPPQTSLQQWALSRRLKMKKPGKLCTSIRSRAEWKILKLEFAKVWGRFWTTSQHWFQNSFRNHDRTIRLVLNQTNVFYRNTQFYNGKMAKISPKINKIEIWPKSRPKVINSQNKSHRDHILGMFEL